MNNLHKATSPYLLQHAHNPVHWQEWSEEVLERAEKEDKLLLVSIGYASCHWCHVMEKESFENNDTADLMNAYFICLKVDREERPDLDAFYMDACQLITGSGGWPLNVFCLPDGRPVHAVTYLPNKQWNQLLFHVRSLWTGAEQRTKALEYADKLTHAIKDMDLLPKAAEEVRDYREKLQKVLSDFLSQTDSDSGGMNRAPKFPLFSVWETLLLAGKHFGKEAFKQQALTTLKRMSVGGIYDTLGGGISRYATDTEWKIPHFEKMLYDNGQYLGLLAFAYEETQEDFYKQRALETLRFLQRELKAPGGIYYAALDADSEGEEGKFYVWNEDEIKSILGKDFDLFADYFTITHRGNWEDGKNILHATESPESFAAKKNIDPQVFLENLTKSKQALFRQRENRERPALDSNMLLSWNALLLTGLSKAAVFIGDDIFLQAAEELYKAMQKHFCEQEEVFRILLPEKNKKVPALLEDYAYWADALYWSYLTDFNHKKLLLAKKLTEQALYNFYSEESGLFFNSRKDSTGLPGNKQETGDDVTPSANAIMCSVLRRTGHYFSIPDYLHKSQRMSDAVLPKALSYPAWHSVWLGELAATLFRNQSLVAAGTHLQKKEGRELFFRAEILGNATTKDIALLSHTHTGYYLCEGAACKPPVASLDKLDWEQKGSFERL